MKKMYLPFPFQEKNLLLFGYGRVALYEALRILGLKEQDTILVPDYVCNVVMAPMHRLNIKVKFYELDSALRPSWAALEQKIDKNTKALLIVNYFGFPNNLDVARTLCDRHGIYLIEDNAHSFLSSDGEKHLGSTGDIGFFSFRKSVSIPNGAGLLINNKSLMNRLPAPDYLRKDKRVLRFIAKTLLTPARDCFSIMGFCKKREIDFDAYRARHVCEEYNIDRYMVRFSRYGYFLMKQFDFGRIVRERRKAYDKWLDFFSRKGKSTAKVIFPVLKRGVVPSCFPLLVDDRRQFISEMWHRGIECFPWPYLPESSREEYFSGHVICLPLNNG